MLRRNGNRLILGLSRGDGRKLRPVYLDPGELRGRVTQKQIEQSMLNGRKGRPARAVKKD